MSRKSWCCLVFVLLFSTFGQAHADPPVLPPVPPPAVPCQPLICVQMTDAQEVAPDSWRFDFEALNWTRFTDRPCPPGSPGCVDRTSPGAPATGLVFVRSASLSTVKFRVLPVDPNGAPLGILADAETASVGLLPGGETGVDLDQRFLSRILTIVDLDDDELLPPSCYELRDPVEGVVVFSDDAACDPIVTALDEVTVQFEAHLGATDVDPNTWTSSLCTADQIVWSQDPAVEPPLEIPAGDTNISPCPTTCEQKDSLGNVLDGFVVEVEDFQPGDRLVFNWYLLGESGPIASGSPPTPTDAGTLDVSPADPWGFSFGSYQIDRKVSCLAGDCDTTILTQPPVTDPTLSCLVDEDLDRNALPFDIYISLQPVGTDPPCSIEPALETDDKGLERLVVRATADASTDEAVVVFRNLENNALDKEVRLPLQAESKTISTADLVGRYEVSGTCLNTVDDRFFFLNKFEMAIPRRGDLAELASSSLAVELDESSGDFALTGTFPAGVLDLDDDAEVCHFVQVRDRDGTVHIIGTAGDPDLLARNAGLLVRDTEAPAVTCEPDFVVGTDADGGDDCALQVSTTARATDAAGGFVLTNDLETGNVTRSFGATVDGQEVADQTATGLFSIGPATDVTFTVTDDAGAAASCSTAITVVDDTAPLVECRLLPDDPPPGNGGGGNGNGNGNGPPGGTPPGQVGSNYFFIVDFTATDNCDPDADLTLTAEIDGITVSDDQPVQITTRNDPPVETRIQNGRLQILTHLGGVLRVTATDLAGNVSVCETVPLVP